MQAEERRFSVNGLTIAAKEWGAGNDYPILALHGWLDNCASFDRLAHLLPDFNFVVPDLAGHGLSSHRSQDSGYNLWQDVGELLQIADQLQWRRFALLGHSRGAMIATLLAAVAPERVTHLALIEGLVPVPLPPEQAPQQLAQSIQDKHKYQRQRRRRYPSLEAAAVQRTLGLFPLQKNEAMHLAERGTRRDGRGYYWSADPRLQGASEVKFSNEQLSAFLRAIEAPVQLFVCERDWAAKKQDFAPWWAMIKRGRLQVLRGSHHLHMEAASQAIADTLRPFLTTSKP